MGELPGKAESPHLDFQATQWDFKVRREPGFVSVSTGEEIFLGHISLVLPDIYIVKLGCIAGLNLDLFGHFSAGVDLVALECAKDRIEAALFDLVSTG